MQNENKTRIPSRWNALWFAMGLALPGLVAAETTAGDDRRVNVNEYIVRGNTVLDEAAIEEAVTPFLGPERTLADIEAARDALLAAYQARGYQSVYVELPEQQVTSGAVLLVVSETRVGRLRVVGAQYTAPLTVRDQVPALKEGTVPDFNQAQAELTALNAGGKRQVMPLVKQGALPGTMDVDLKVDDQQPWRVSAGLSNDYSADTSKLRAFASVGHDNLWQRGHSASLSFYGAPENLGETNVWSASYSAPIPGTHWSVEASGYVSDSNVATVGGTTVIGKGHTVGVKATYTVPDTGNWWHAVSLGVDFKEYDEQLRLGGSGDTVPLKYAPVTLSYSGFLQNERSQYGLGLSLVAGTRNLLGYGSDWREFDYKRYKASSSFMLLKGDVNGSHDLPGDWQFGWRLAGQLTDSALISSEQMAAGGLYSVRGYLSAEATGDYGLAGSLELRSKPLTFAGDWLERWRLYSFIDAGHLRLADRLPEQDARFSLLSLGVGTSFRVGGSVNGRLDYGYPLKDGPRTDRHDPLLNFSIDANY